MMNRNKIIAAISAAQPALAVNAQIIDYISSYTDLCEIIALSKQGTVTYDDAEDDATLSGKIEIDSETADQMIEAFKYESNRKINEGHIATIKRTMTSGYFKPSSTSIGFAYDQDGKFCMVNGNHTLTALRRLGDQVGPYSFRWTFHINLDAKSAYLIYDAGKARSVADRDKAIDLGTELGLADADTKTYTKALSIIMGNGSNSVNTVDQRLTRQLPFLRLKMARTYASEFKRYMAMLDTIDPKATVGITSYSDMMKFFRLNTTVAAVLVAMKSDPENSEKYLDFMKGYFDNPMELGANRIGLITFASRPDVVKAYASMAYQKRFIAALHSLVGHVSGTSLTEKMFSRLSKSVTLSKKNLKDKALVPESITVGSFTKDYMVPK